MKLGCSHLHIWAKKPSVLGFVAGQCSANAWHSDHVRTVSTRVPTWGPTKPTQCCTHLPSLTPILLEYTPRGTLCLPSPGYPTSSQIPCLALGQPLALASPAASVHLRMPSRPSSSSRWNLRLAFGLWPWLLAQVCPLSGILPIPSGWHQPARGGPRRRRLSGGLQSAGWQIEGPQGGLGGPGSTGRPRC